jgi:hypothetical protein
LLEFLLRLSLERGVTTEAVWVPDLDEIPVGLLELFY